MSRITCYDLTGDVLDHFTQWDVGQVIIIKGLTSDNAPNVHFTNRYHDKALVVPSVYKGSDLYVDVPNVLLQENSPIIAYLYQRYDENSSKTIHTITINVVPRAKPHDYNYVENIEYIDWVERCVDEALNKLLGGTVAGAYYEQDEEPEDAPVGSFWMDTDDESNSGPGGFAGMADLTDEEYSTLVALLEEG